MSDRLRIALALLASAVIFGAMLGVVDRLVTPLAVEDRSDTPVGADLNAPGPVDLGAPTALSRIRVADAVDDGTYERSEFGYDWLDLDGDGCNTREEIMARDLTDTERPDGCNVVAGVLDDPYTGRSITYSESDPTAVQIDHVYPLSLAWQHGAEQWSDERREAFANDPRNLIAADGPTNASKGDSGPADWMPLDRDFVCTYARRYAQVAYAYRLTISAADRDSLRLALGTC